MRTCGLVMGFISPEQALTAAWQAVVHGRRGDEGRAWLEAIPPGPRERAKLALLCLVWGEPWRALALVDGSELDEDDAPSIVAHAIRSNLLGEPERARNERAKLVALASRSRPEGRLQLLLLAGLLAEQARALDEAEEHFREVAVARNGFSDWLRHARALVANGKGEAFLETVGELMTRGDAKDEDLARLGALCDRIGAHELAVDLYARVAKTASRAETRTLAHLAWTRRCIWKLSLHDARAHLSCLEDAGASEKEVHKLRAILELFDKKPKEALSMLDDFALRWPESRDPEYWLVRAEAALQEGSFKEVDRSVQQANLIETTFVAQILSARLRLAIEALPWAKVRELGVSDSFFWLGRKCVNRFEPWLKRAAVSSAWAERALQHLNPEIGIIIGQISEPFAKASNSDAGAAVAVLDELRAQLGGNRSSTPTRRVISADGEARLESWRLPANDRQASSQLLHRLGQEEPEEILRKFELLASRFPRSPFPFTYQGELRLWLGDYRGAQTNFEEALRRRSTRWAYVGLAAIAMLEGRTLRARRWFAEGSARFGELLSATTYVYRGEQRRRLGDYPRALLDLELAVRYRPHRVGARMNLALTLAALGRRSEADDELRRAVSLLPSLFHLAADALSRPWPTRLDIDTARPFIERAFELMRGNRSSWMHTAFDKDGKFRVLPMAKGWQDFATRELSRLHKATASDGPVSTSVALSGPTIKSAAKPDHAD